MENNEGFGEQRGELVEAIRRDEEDLREAVHELTDAARSTFTLREHIKANPLAWMAGALLFGMWLGTLHRPARIRLDEQNGGLQ